MMTPSQHLIIFICIFSLFSNTDEPRTMKVVMEMEDKESFILVIEEEMDLVRKNDTWGMVTY